MKKYLVIIALLLLVTLIPVNAFAAQGWDDAEYDPFAEENLDDGALPEDRHAYEEQAPSRYGFYALRPTVDPRYINALISQQDHTKAQVSFFGNYALCDDADTPQFKMTEGYVYSINVNGTKIELKDASGQVLYSGSSFYFKEYAPPTGLAYNYFKVAMVSNSDDVADRIYKGELNCYYQAASGVYAELWSGLYLVNRIYIEEYLKGVLPAEIGASAVIEAQKAQAIVCRNFAVGAKRTNRFFDVYDYNKSQVYFGIVYDAPLTEQAVDATAGQVLTYNGSVIKAYFGNTNGGWTEVSSNQWTGTENCGPESVRYDEFDVLATRYIEEVTIPAVPIGSETEVVSLINNALIPALAGYSGLTAQNVAVTGIGIANGPCYSASVCRHHHRDETEGQVCGHFCSVNATFSGITLNVNGTATPVADVTVNLKDIDFYVNPANGRKLGFFTNGSLGRYWLIPNTTQNLDGTSTVVSYTIRHARHGHGVGMSQQSAINRAKAGQNAAQILGFFFPNCTLAPHAQLGAADTLAAMPTTFAKDVRVSGSDSLVYAKANTKSIVRGIMKAETTVEVLASNASWVKITFEGKEAYVPAVAFERAYIEAAVSSVYQSLSIRRDLAGTQKATVYPGNSFELLQANASAGWHKIKYNNQEYYIASRYSTLKTAAQLGRGTILSAYPVTVTVPAGYTDTKLWVDGVPYSGTAANGSLTASVYTNNAKTAVMYYYNSSNIPMGMAVWTLDFANNAYTATRITGFDDLLSYHGFSARIEGSSGIRFKSGIAQTTREALLGSGILGYKLVEYGTVAFNYPEYYGDYPFVIDDSGALPTVYGRSYYTENGAIKDYIVETVGGRVRFASVRVNIPDEELATNFLFRGYIKLTNGSDTITVYGAPMSRSIYTLAKSFMDRGTYTDDSSEGIFLNRIIDYVEGNN